jgi:hypothetical protein
MCLRIRNGGVMLFAAITIWSAISTGATAAGWPVRIIGMELAPVTATAERRKSARAMQLRVRRDTGPEWRQDTQLPAMQHQAMQPRERCISPALPPDSLGTAHAPALRALLAGQTQPRQRQPHHQLLLQPPHSVMHAGR